MQLPPDQVERFYSIWIPLFHYVKSPSGTWSSLSRQARGKPISRLRVYKSFAMLCGEMTPCVSVS